MRDLASITTYHNRQFSVKVSALVYCVNKEHISDIDVIDIIVSQDANNSASSLSVSSSSLPILCLCVSAPL